MLKPQFATNEIYHIYNRGVEKRKIFLEDNDYLRFIHNLFEFNDTKPAPSFIMRYSKQKKQFPDNNSDFVNPNIREPRTPIVEVLAFCLMQNHYHLLLKQNIDNGIVQFMRKLGCGYANYFNQKYKRVGSLFQGRFKAVLVQNESHFIYLPYYIHFNPLDLIEPDWRKGEIKNNKQAWLFLESYRWSSFLDYIGKKNFPSVTQRDFLLTFFTSSTAYKTEIKQWLQNIKIESLQNLILE